MSSTTHGNVETRHIENQLLCYSRLADEKQFEALANIDTGGEEGGLFRYMQILSKNTRIQASFRLRISEVVSLYMLILGGKRNDQFDSGSVECIPKMT